MPSTSSCSSDLFIPGETELVVVPTLPQRAKGTKSPADELVEKMHFRFSGTSVRTISSQDVRESPSRLLSLSLSQVSNGQATSSRGRRRKIARDVVENRHHGGDTRTWVLLSEREKTHAWVPILGKQFTDNLAVIVPRRNGAECREMRTKGRERSSEITT